MLRELNTNEMEMVSGGLINTGIEILHIDANIFGTALVQNGIGYNEGGVDTIYDNPANSLWFAMGTMLGTIGYSDENPVPICAEELMKAAKITGATSLVLGAIGHGLSGIPHLATQAAGRAFTAASFFLGGATGAVVLQGCPE